MTDEYDVRNIPVFITRLQYCMFLCGCINMLIWCERRITSYMTFNLSLWWFIKKVQIIM